jgi:LacI family transcriptional regulator
MTPKKEITLQDIADELNISKVSVSKALRDHPDIGTETKRLVREAAERLGYSPNFIARNLSSRQSRTIGLVVPKIAHYFFASAIESIYRTAYEHDYEIIMTVSQEEVERENMHIQSLLSMRVDGLLISVTEQTKDKEVFESVRKRGIPLVFFDRVFDDIGFSTVTSDDEQGSYEAITEVIHSGYTKFAHLAGYSYTNIGGRRLSGFKRALTENKIEVPEKWIIETGFAENDGYKGFLNLFRRGSLPEVIFAVTYPVALGVLLAAEEMGIAIPEELQVLSFGGSIYNRFVSPSITYIDQPAEEMGRKATELLLSEIKNPEMRQEEHNIMPTELVFCDTCKQKSEDV